MKSAAQINAANKRRSEYRRRQLQGSLKLRGKGRPGAPDDDPRPAVQSRSGLYELLAPEDLARLLRIRFVAERAAERLMARFRGQLDDSKIADAAAARELLRETDVLTNLRLARAAPHRQRAARRTKNATEARRKMGEDRRERFKKEVAQLAEKRPGQSKNKQAQVLAKAGIGVGEHHARRLLKAQSRK